MKVIFILKGGAGTITWDVPLEMRPTFSFVGAARGIRCDGFFQSEDMHVRYEEIGAMIYDRDGQAPKTVLPQGQTMQ